MEDKTKLGCVLAIVVILLIPVSYILNGFTLSTLWNWFIPNVFVGAPTLTIMSAIGLSIVIGWFKNGLAAPTDVQREGKNERDTNYLLMYGIVMTFLQPAIALFFGYIIHLYMIKPQ